MQQATGTAVERPQRKQKRIRIRAWRELNPQKGKGLEDEYEEDNFKTVVKDLENHHGEESAGRGEQANANHGTRSSYTTHAEP